MYPKQHRAVLPTMVAVGMVGGSPALIVLVFTDARQSDTAIDYAIASLLSERLSLGRNTEPVGDIRAPDCVSDRDRGHGAIAIRKYRRTLPRVSRGPLDDLKRQIGQWHNMGVGIFGSASR